ncbi:MAG: hypothetical protein H6558_12085 [Lewinellaceae bacterium]|nr:hypothetical protein [Lewinellaceae bacterium]
MDFIGVRRQGDFSLLQKRAPATSSRTIWTTPASCNYWTKPFLLLRAEI